MPGQSNSLIVGALRKARIGKASQKTLYYLVIFSGHFSTGQIFHTDKLSAFKKAEFAFHPEIG